MDVRQNGNFHTRVLKRNEYNDGTSNEYLDEIEKYTLT